MKSQKIYLSLIFLLLFSIAAGYLLTKEKPKHSQKISIAVMDWPGFYPLFVAKHKNYFADEGFDIKLILCNDNLCTNDKLITGEAQMAFGALADYVKMRGNGHQIKFIFLSDFSKMDTLAGKFKKEQMSKVNPLKIGIGELHSFSEFFTLQILEKQQVNLNNVIFKVIPYLNINESLKSGQIDAGHTWEPELGKSIKGGFQIIDTSASLLGVISDGLAIREDLINDKNMISQIINSLIRATQDFYLNTSDFCQIVADELDIPKAEVLRLMTDGVQLLGLMDNLKAFNSQKAEFTSLEFNISKVSEFLLQRGQITSAIQKSDLIDFTPLSEIIKETKHEN